MKRVRARVVGTSVLGAGWWRLAIVGLLALPLAGSRADETPETDKAAAPEKKAPDGEAKDAILKESKVPGSKLPDIARVKQEDALNGMERLEAMLDRVANLLVNTEPRNAAKLRMAFRKARRSMVRERMERIVKFLEDRKLDRAVEAQEEVQVDLEQLLDILLEKDIDPRELLKEIRRLRDMLKQLDEIIEEETQEKLASDDADDAGAESKALSEDLRTLEDLIRREAGLESKSRDAASRGGEGLSGLQGEQEKVREDTRALREKDASREGKPKESSDVGPPGEGKPGEGKPGEGKPGEGKPGEGKPGAGQPGAGKPGEGKPGEGKPGAGQPGAGKPGEGASGQETAKRTGPVLDRKKLSKAEEAMAEAEKAMSSGEASDSVARTAEARQALEDAVAAAREKLEKLRRQRDFPTLKKDQDATQEKTDALADRMKRAPPLVLSEDGSTPGRQDVQAASESMGGASGELGGGRPREASRDQQEALKRLNQGRQKTEETLEELQRALRDRLIAYLKEKFGFMLREQQAIRRETRSLDLRLRALRLKARADAEEFVLDRKDLRQAESLSSREGRLHLMALDIIDLLTEDGTSVVFPEIVGEIADDMDNVRGLLARVEPGALTQRMEEDIEAAIDQILKALEEARQKPPPPNPNQGRNSRSGASPLLPKSSELKMVRALQLRVNKRTAEFDLDRQAVEELDAGRKLQVERTGRKQKPVENLLRKVAGAVRRIE